MNDNTLLLDNPRAVIGGNIPPEPTLEEELAEGFAPLADRVETLAAKANALPKKIENDAALGDAADIGKQARKLIADIETDRKAKKEPWLEAGRLVDQFYGVPKDQVARLSAAIEARATDYQRALAAEARRRAEEEARKAREEEQRRADLAQKAMQEERHAHAALHEDRADEAAEVAARADALARSKAADLARVRSSTGTVASPTTTWKIEILDKGAIDLEPLRPFLTVEQLQVAANAWCKANARGATVAPVLKGARVFQDIQTRFR